MLHCQETLRSLRETEAKRQQENWKIQQLEAKHVKEAKVEHLETEEQPLTQSQKESNANVLNNELIFPHSINGILETTEADKDYPPDDVGTDNSGSPSWYSQSINSKQKSVLKRFAGNRQAVKGYEWIEMGMKGDQCENEMEEEEKIVESQMTNEQRVSFNHRASNVDNFILSNAADSLGYNTTGPHILLLGELPDVDYPTNEDSTLQLSHQPAISREEPEVQHLPAERRIATRKNSDSPSVKQDTRRNSSYSESDDVETSTETWGFSKNLKSPELRRKRPVSTLQGPSAQMSNQDSTETFAASNNSSSSNKDSDYNQNTKRNSVPTGQSSDSHRVLKLGSLKPNQGMFLSMNDIVSPDRQTLSEPELPDLNKRPKMKSERGTFISNTEALSTEGGHGLHLPSSSMSTLHEEADTHLTISGDNLNEQPSILEGLLERAKERVRERNGLKIDTNLKTANLSSRYPPLSPSIFTTPSPSPSDGDRETEWGEKEVELTRHRASTVSERWKEQLVDEDDDEKRNRLVLHALLMCD